MRLPFGRHGEAVHGGRRFAQSRVSIAVNLVHPACRAKAAGGNSAPAQKPIRSRHPHRVRHLARSFRMAGKIEARLAELGIVLPSAPAPAANYVPFTVSRGTVYVAGQVPFVDGKIGHRGRIGETYAVAEGRAIARICGLNILAQLKAACGGDLDRVVRCLKVGGFVACPDGFTEQPEVVNGASDLMVEVFGDAGRHARFAVGSNALPRNVPVEVDAIFEID
jgi:enamine deaminase RidA (YjgF/YER057c/UK114 family)